MIDCIFCERVEQDNGETKFRLTDGSLSYMRDLPTGALFWWTNVCCEHEPECEHHLWLMLPNRVHFDIDGRASNCANKTDRVHHCWHRVGEPPNITLSPGCGSSCSILCNAGDLGTWHGFLENGKLRQV